MENLFFQCANNQIQAREVGLTEKWVSEPTSRQRG